MRGFIEQKGVDLQQKFVGYRKKKIDSFGDFLSTLLVYVFIAFFFFFSFLFSFQKALHCEKNIRIPSFSGPHFLVFVLNIEKYGVSNADTFHAFFFRLFLEKTSTTAHFILRMFFLTWQFSYKILACLISCIWLKFYRPILATSMKFL